MDPKTITWIYIVFLVAGGLIGFFKAKSQVSLITSVSAAVILMFTAIDGLMQDRAATGLADIVMGVLLVVFTIRLTKTQKFMPSGMMLVVTIVALALRHVRF